MQNEQTTIEREPFFPGRRETGKVLMACVPADGHFNPLTGIAKYLQSQGYDVRWYISKTYEAKLKKLEIPYYPFKKALEVTGSNVDSIFPERTRIHNKIRKLNFDIINFFALRGPEYFDDISEIYKTFPFDLMIADCAFTAVPIVKEKLNIPVISIGVLPLYTTSGDLPPSGLGMTPSYSIAGRAKQSILRYFTNRVMFREANRVMRTTLGKYNIHIGDLGVFDVLVNKSTLLLQSGTPGFEYRRSDLGNNIRFIGPLLPYQPARKTVQWFDERLNQYDKIILVTQGTVEKDVEKILVPTLEAFSNSDTLVIATTGGSNTWELRERYPGNNIIIEDFIPFEDVMPYADVYVSNGGYGGVLLAIENKLPMVVAGVHEGKNEINARIGYFNLGINLETELPAIMQIRAAVEEVLGNDIYKKHVVRLGKEFDRYDPMKLTAGYVNEVLQEKAGTRKVHILPAFPSVSPA